MKGGRWSKGDAEKKAKRDADILKMREEGATYAEIGKKFDLHPMTVGHIVRDARNPQRKQDKPAAKARKLDAAIAKSLKAGDKTHEEIADEHGVDVARVERVAEAADSKRHSQRHKEVTLELKTGDEVRTVTTHSEHAERDARIYDLVVNHDMSYAEVGDMYGITRARVGMIMGELGIPHIREYREEKFTNIVKAAIEAGKDSEQVAAESGKDPAFWERFAAQHDLPLKGREGAATETFTQRIDNRDAEIIAMLNEGHTQQQVADAFGTSQANISRIAHKHGIKRRLLGDDAKERNERIIKYLDEGHTIEETANEFGLCTATIYIIKHSQDIEVHHIPQNDSKALAKRDAAIEKDLRAGMSHHDAAQRNHATIMTVMMVARKMHREDKESAAE